MDAAQIAAMIADREAGTPGPWNVKFRKDGSAYMSMGGDRPGDAHSRFSIGLDSQYPSDVTNARRISRVPDMEATIIAQSAELATMREALSSRLNLWNRAEIQDGYILLWRDGDIIARLSFDMWNAGLEQFHQEAIVGDVLDAFQARSALKGGTQ